MKELMIELILIFIFALVFSTGLCSLKKYKEDNEDKPIKFWKELLIVVGYSVFSIIILPIAIAKWAVNLTLDFKEE